MDPQKSGGNEESFPRQFLNRYEALACYALAISPFFEHQYQLAEVLDADTKTVRDLFRDFKLPEMLGTGEEVPPEMMQQVIARMLRDRPRPGP